MDGLPTCGRAALQLLICLALLLCAATPGRAQLEEGPVPGNQTRRVVTRFVLSTCCMSAYTSCNCCILLARFLSSIIVISHVPNLNTGLNIDVQVFRCRFTTHCSRVLDMAPKLLSACRERSL